MLEQNGHSNTRPLIGAYFSGHGCMDELTTERTLICKLRESLMCLTYIFDILGIVLWTTRHFHKSGRPDETRRNSDRLITKLRFLTTFSNTLAMEFKHPATFIANPMQSDTQIAFDASKYTGFEIMNSDDRQFFPAITFSLNRHYSVVSGGGNCRKNHRLIPCHW